MRTRGDNLLFCPLLESLCWRRCSILRQVSATDTCRVRTRLPTQLSFVGSTPDLPTMRESWLLWPLVSQGRICTWCTVSQSAFVPVVSRLHPSVPVLTSGLQRVYEFLRRRCCRPHSITPFFNLLLCQVSTLISYPSYTWRSSRDSY